MPTIICIDVSLSLQRQVDSVSLLDHSLAVISSFITNLHTLVPQEYIELVTFSHSPTVLVPFTKNTSQLTEALGKVKCGDKTNVTSLIELVKEECLDWNVLTPTHIILLTDKIPNSLTEAVGSFPFGCHISLVALRPTVDVHSRTQAFFTSCNLKGKLYAGPVLGRDRIDRIFENIMLEHYSKQDVTLWLGHQSTSVSIVPVPDLALLTGVTGKPTPRSFPPVLRIHGFVSLADLHNPPYSSKHLLYPATSGKGAAKSPDLRVILNDALRHKTHVALVALGLGWYGVVSSYLPKTERNVKKSNLALCIIAPHSCTWLGNLDFLGLKRLVSTEKQSTLPYRELYSNRLVSTEKQSTLPYREFYSNSYDNKSGGAMVWVKANTLKQNIMKVVRYAKRLPDKGGSIFIKEINKVRKSILYYGYQDMLQVLCELLEKEITPHNKDLLEKCVMQLREEKDPLKPIK